MTFRFLLFLFLLFILDLYVFQGVKTLVHGKAIGTQRIFSITHWTVAALCLAAIVMTNIFEWRTWPKALSTYTFAILVIIYLSKIFVVVFLLVDDLLRVMRWTGGYVAEFISPQNNPDTVSKGISRYDFLVRMGFIVGSIPFLSMMYGMLGSAYNYRIRKVNLKFPNLPDAFDGLKVVQISDLHIGSFMGGDHLKRAIDLIHQQKPDLILFTGDLVNDRYIETLEHQHLLAEIKAPLGVYSVFGNHDYGDYYNWPNPEEKMANLQNLANLHEQLGWKLLLNEHDYIRRGDDHIGIIGVENWSSRMNFRRYGDMKKATDEMKTAPFNILLSHDPSHWKAEITSQYKHVDLTLAGHTHGMQFGIEIPGFKWSPVKYVYNEWADLYKEGSQYLYVNRGLGFIGYPGRVGILPEITLFELNTLKQYTT